MIQNRATVTIKRQSRNSYAIYQMVSFLINLNNLSRFKVVPYSVLIISKTVSDRDIVTTEY